jgi:general secretion pathway protein G
MMKPSKRRKRGFTLIEVLLVLVILVILASLATFNILSAQKKAYRKTAQTQVELLDKAVLSYQLDIGTFPNNLQALVSPPADIPDPTKWQGPYLSRDVLPLDPWRKPYQINPPGGHNRDKPDIFTTTPENEVIGNWDEGQNK